MSQQEPTVALLPWGNVIEDFLDPLGISQDQFCTDFRGSYMFGYVEALKQVGVRTVIICMSARVDAPTRRTHVPTGATVYFLPSPRLFRWVQRRMVYPYGQTVREAFGELRGIRRLLLPFCAIARESALYLSTPLTTLVETLRLEGCDAILCQEYEFPRFDICVVLGNRLRRPVFATFQGGNYHHGHLEQFIRPLSLRACAGLVIGSGREVERVRRRYGIARGKIARIFNPVNLSVWKAGDRVAARAALGIPLDARVVAWHGRIAMHKKGLDLLLEAWERLIRQYPNETLRLVVVGTGDDAQKLQQRIAKMQGLIWINRFVHDAAKLVRYLAAADAYALPSRYEGFPVALIEAMACGLAVVAADTDGVRDILGEGFSAGGVLVPPEDPEALANALGAVLFAPAWAHELGKNARFRVEAACSLEAVGNQLRGLLLDSPTKDNSANLRDLTALTN